MQLLFASQSFAGRIVEALCWMLVHSLWQALLLAFVAGIVIILTKRSSSLLRYNLLAIASLAFIAGALATFIVKMDNLPVNGTALAATGFAADAAGITSASATAIGKSDTTFAGGLVLFFNKYSTFIVLGWLMVIAFRCIRLIGGLYNIQQIKSSAVSLPGDEWNERINKLCTQLGITRPVQFLQSGIIKIPMVLGHLKPVILFPAGILTSLSQGEIEAILVHELAHIRRNDYLVNIVQSFLEIMFFFNPAAIWVSSLIKTERENCCDDIAVIKAGSKRNYINALLSFQEYNINIPQYAIALGGKKDHLLQRVKRIIYNNNKTLNAMEKIFLASGLVVTGLLVFAFSSNDPEQHQKTNAGKLLQKNTVENTVAPFAVMDTIPPLLNPAKIITTSDDKEYVIELKGDRVTALYIDGKKIPDEKISDFKSTTDKIIKEVKAQSEKARTLEGKARQQAEELRVQAEKLGLEKGQEEKVKLLIEQSEMMTAEAEEKATELQLGQQKLQREVETMRERVEMSGKGEKEIAMATRERVIALKNQQLALEQQLKQIKAAGNNMPQEALLKKLRTQIQVEHQKLAKLDAERETLLLKLEQTQQLSEIAAEQANSTSAISEQLVEELISSGLIKEGEKASIILNTKELLINGVKQSPEVLKKFKEKYVKNSSFNLNIRQ